MTTDILRIALKDLLGASDLKSKIFKALEAEAKKTDTEIDDDVVAACKAIYDVIVPVIIGHI